MKIRKYENYRVIVAPSEGWALSRKKTEDERRIQECNCLIDSIKKHCDDFDDIEWDRDAVDICSFCGEVWDVGLCKDGEYAGCCEEAIEEIKAERVQ